MKTRTITFSLFSLVALAILPLRTDGGQPECCNATASFTSTAVGPVAGDEAFFKLPTGPANAMFLLDNSGSMSQFTQCGDNSWDDNGARTTCTSPPLAAPTQLNTAGTTFVYTGTCAPSTLTTPTGANSPLAWMEAVVPTRNLPDPGQSNALLTDAPPWGTGCKGDACLFDPDAYFLYGDWSTSNTGNNSTRRASDVDGTLPKGCTALTTGGAAVTDLNNKVVVLGSDCTTCMDSHGFFFYRLMLVTQVNGSKVPTKWGSASTTEPMFKGTFLNANPPKFVSARKAVKSVAWMDPAAPGKLDQVRMGLTILNSSAKSPQRADLIVPLGPDKTNSYPPSQASFRQARQYILSVLNYDTAVYKDAVGNVICDGSKITGGFFDPASTNTPMASALFNVGQHFGSTGRYNFLLGNTACSGKSCQVASFNDSSPGLSNAPWAQASPTQCSICWACQNNGVIIVTDGAPNSEITFPNAISNYDTAAYNSVANCGANAASADPIDNATCGGSPLPRVASWLHASDLRDDAVMSGKQAIVTHTVGLNLIDPQAIKTLRATANMGTGLWQNATDPKAIGDAVYNAINQIAPKENSFSAASASSLQTVQTAASQAFLTRFKPSQNITWEGHVFEGYLFDEFLNGCDTSLAVQPTVTCKTKTVSADFNGDGQCNGVFFIDKDCDEVAEDLNGDFVKKGQAIKANLPWDAGLVLSDPAQVYYRSADETSAKARNIFTWINGARVDFKASNAATLLASLNISPAWCTSFLTRIGVAGGASPTLTCAQQVIYFVRGWDVLDQNSNGCAGPGNPKNTAACKSGLKGEERDRPNDTTATPTFWKLGDIFHSSPAVLQVPADEIRCDTGYDRQCVATIHSPAGLPVQTPISNSYTGSGSFKIDAYAKYRLNTLARKRLVLVGANDGMLHAFDAGALDTSVAADATGDYQYTDGTGEELWAFIPPDMLPRLYTMLDAHQYMVDGSVMVRDIWVDGSGTEVSGVNRIKESDEFHTVAIFGRRAGGTAYSALDVTNPLAPTLLWNFPLGCSDDARYMGESWNDFSPRPPPIVPIKLASASDPRGFEERWVTMINGGYDPMMVQGRAVFMVDAWTGGTLWRFTDADFKAQTGYGAGTSMFPVAASPAMVDIGDPTKTTDADGFFDTATWGDLGGNLWVARFQDPGVLDKVTGRVTNWYAARAFEEQRQLDDSQPMANRSEFFFMTANAFDSTSRTLRTYLGSGNREQVMAQSASCGTDNLLGCARAGCTKITASTKYDYGACNGTGTFSVVGGAASFATSTTAACGTGAATCAAGPGNAYKTALATHLECPGSPATTTDLVGSSSCDTTGLCSVVPMPATTVAGTFATVPRSRFYGVWAYGGNAKKIFNDPATALDFDKNRFTDVTYAGCSGPTGGNCKLVDTTTATVTKTTTNPLLISATCGSGVTQCTATASDAGWYYEYGRVCPFGTCNPAPPWLDEKTGSGATVVLGCTAWGSFRPVGAVTATDPCTGSLGVPASYAYNVQYLTGTPNPTVCGTFATAKSLTSPPTAPSVRVTVIKDPKGGPSKVRYSKMNLDAGSAPANQSMGTRTTGAEPIYWLEVPRDLHDCRHTNNPGACK